MASRLGRRLKDFRLDRQYNQTKMAAILDVSLATIVRLEAGKSVADMTRAKIEKFLNSQAVAA